MSRLSEGDLIHWIREGRQARNSGVKTGMGDDCAVLRIDPGEEMLVTTDFSLEGRHFRRDWHTAASAGHRCLARGLSDIAAMGGRPVAAFLSLALPANFELAWLDGFMSGFQGLARVHGVELAGGDTAETAGTDIVADVVLVGAVQSGKALLRSGARRGEAIYVTGTLGGSAVELEEMRAGRARREREAEACPQSYPQPRVGVGLALARLGVVSSCMDMSDGLSTDLRRLCQASGVGAEVTVAEVPIAAGATLPQALHGGEDYELLLTVRGGMQLPESVAGVRLTRIGRTVDAAQGVSVVGLDSTVRELTAEGWEHFGA